MVAVSVRLPALLGAIVYAERTARGLTQAQLALAAGLHPMALSKIERGVQQDVGVETLRRIAEALSATGASVATSGLVASAERWLAPLNNGEAGDVPPDATGAALTARIALLASKEPT